MRPQHTGYPEPTDPQKWLQQCAKHYCGLQQSITWALELAQTPLYWSLLNVPQPPSSQTDFRSPSKLWRLSLKRAGQQLALPPFSQSPAPSACSHWPPAAPSSASPIPPAQPRASGAVLSVSGVLLCGAEGSPLAAGSQWSVWLGRSVQNTGRVGEHHWWETPNFPDSPGKWIPVLGFFFPVLMRV